LLVVVAVVPLLWVVLAVLVEAAVEVHQAVMVETRPIV
jgi:phosphatidylglycerophosphate synthase